MGARRACTRVETSADSPGALPIYSGVIREGKAAVRAIRCAKSLNPTLVIFAKTEYTSTALLARKAGADVVISAETAAARQFRQPLLCLTGGLPIVAAGKWHRLWNNGFCLAESSDCPIMNCCCRDG